MISHKLTHMADALAKLLTQFKDRPDIAALFNSVTVQIQELEDVQFQLLDERAIDTAVGAQLDAIGRILNVERAALSDTDYRTRLQVQIAINQSSGTIEDLINIIRLSGWFTAMLITEGQAEFTLEMYGDVISEEVAVMLAGFIKESRAAGVYAYLAYATSEGSGGPYFSFGPASDVDGDVGGFDTGAFIGAVES